MGRGTKKTRLQVEVSENAAKRLEELKSTTGAGSVAEVVREALRLYEFVVRETMLGAEVISERGDTRTPLIILGGVSEAKKKQKE